MEEEGVVGKEGQAEGVGVEDWEREVGYSEEEEMEEESERVKVVDPRVEKVETEVGVVMLAR